MVYYVIEFQTTGNQGATIVNSYTNRTDAESKYYHVLFSAISSNIPKHGVAMFDSNMVLIKNDLAYRSPNEEEEE